MGARTGGVQRRSQRQVNPRPRAPLRYILFNKPYGVLSQFTPDHPGQRTLAEFNIPGGLYAAGRLDHDSEGLLLLTNDGPLIKRLLDPEHGHARTYLVQVEHLPDEESIRSLRSGVTLGASATRPAEVDLLAHAPDVPERVPPIRERKHIPTAWLRMTLREGKNRQVRRMTAAVGHPTLRLLRESILHLTTEGLEQGMWRELDPQEIRKLKHALQLS